MNDSQIVTNGMCCQIEYDAIIKACNGENYTMSLTGEDAEVVVKTVNIGIDSRLQAIFGEFNNGARSFIATKDTQFWNEGQKVIYIRTLECSVYPKSLPVLLRRLYEDMESTEEDDENDDDTDDVGSSLAESILTTLGFDDTGKFVGRKAMGLE